MERLNSLKQSISGQWLVIGDFNECREIEDKHRGNEIITRGIDRFNETCYELEVFEAKTIGPHLTWVNGQKENPILRKLYMSRSRLFLLLRSSFTIRVFRTIVHWLLIFVKC